MEALQRGRIARRLVFGFSLLFLFFFVYGFFSLYHIRTLSELTRTIYRHPLVVSNAALQANVSITKIHRHMKDIVLFKSPSRIEQSITAVNDQEQMVYHYLDIVRNQILGDKGRALENESRTQFDSWRPIRNEVIALVQQGKRDEAAEITIGKGANHVAKLEKQMIALNDYARDKATSFMESSEKTYQRLWMSSIIAFILIMTISLLIAFSTWKGISSAEDKLRKTNALLDTTGRMARVGGWEVDANTLEVTWSDQTHRIHEVPLDYKPSLQEAINFFHPEDRPKLEQAIQRALDHGEPYGMEIRFITAKGNNLWVRTIGKPETVDGKTLKLKGAFHDITERKQAEKSLVESEKRYRTLFEFMEEGFLRADKNGNIILANMAVAKLCGYESPEEMLGLNMTALYADSNDREKMIRTVRDEGILYNYEILLKKKDGHYFWTSSNIKIIEDEHGDRIGTEGLIRDISDRKRSEQRVEHLNRVLRAIRDVNQLIVRESDPETLIREGCRIMVDNRGYSSALIILKDGKNLFSKCAGSGLVYSSETLHEILKYQEELPCCVLASETTDAIVIDDRSNICGSCPIANESHGSISLCVKLTHGDNTFGYLIAAVDNSIGVDEEELSLLSEMAGDLSYALNFIQLETDHQISERKRVTLEQQLLQSQKMEAVGRLAGGVAHDYNNMLSIIIGYSESALENLDSKDPLYEDMTEIYEAGKRSADITRQLLAFARQQTTAPKVLDLNNNIESMLKMLRRLIGEDIDLAWLPETELWSVKIDPTQLDQVLANLCVNAKDAIGGVGKVTIETENAVFDEEYCAHHAGYIPGEYVMLALSDTGCGISNDMLDNIFEPFFTTKQLHQGTGLGLSTVYGIVKQNEGFINVYSEPEKGTTLKIYLPRYVGQIADVNRETVQEILSGQNETILLVEDDPSILKLAKKMLKSFNYKVLAANNPNEAITRAKKYSGKIHLLVTDVVMPEMNGRELSEQLQKKYPSLKTLFMSGYTANVIAHRGVLEDGVHFIPKPLNRKELAKKVRETLDSAS